MASQPGRVGHRNRHTAQNLAQAAQAVFADVLPGWSLQTAGSLGEPIDRTVEAHVAAACQGCKPLYFDIWGDYAALAAERLRQVLPRDVEIRAENGILYVYTTAAVKPILDADAEFYRPNGEDDFAAIRRASELAQNGELLGYGARSINAPDSVGVEIRDSRHHLLFSYFVAPDGDYLAYANARALDISAALNIKTYYEIKPNPRAKK